MADLGGPVVALDDLCGREAARISEHLGLAWDRRWPWHDVVHRAAPATVVDEPFLAIEDIAWGWPGPWNSRGRPYRVPRFRQGMGQPTMTK
jgi:hypothetical protein